MRNLKAITLSAALLAALPLLTGCPDARLSNQGGGSLVSAGVKVAGNQISALTPDELQVLSDTAASAIDDPQFSNFVLSDDEAEAISDFLTVNGLNSISDVQEAVNNPNSLTVPESLQSLVESGAFGL